MSFFGEDHFILFLDQKFGAPAYVSLLLLLGLCIGLNHTLCAQECPTLSKSNTPSSLNLNTERSSYIQKSVNLLKVRSQGGCVNPSSPKHIIVEEGDVYSYRLFEGTNCVSFPNGESMYFLIHSGHEQESIGDLTLAIDIQGRLYLNEGHVCGGLIHFYSNEKGSLETVNNFIHSMKSDTDDKPFSLLSEQLNHP
jgi:hypothetical protein